jgi:hypothetical protein
LAKNNNPQKPDKPDKKHKALYIMRAFSVNWFVCSSGSGLRVKNTGYLSVGVHMTTHSPLRYRHHATIIADKSESSPSVFRMRGGRKQPKGAKDVGGVLRGLERHHHMALRGQVVYLIWLHFLDDADKVGGVGEVSVVQPETHLFLVRVGIQVVDTRSVKG